MSGIFITLEGGEGVGKSTLTQRLADHFRDSGRRVLLTREPGGTPVADQLRAVFVSPPNEETILIEAELCMVSAARAQHLSHKIIPAIKDDAIVICDRFADSSRVYQGLVGGIDRAKLENIISMTTYGYEPDLTLVLDCPAKIMLERLKGRTNEPDSRYDSGNEAFHEKIRQGFLALADEFQDRMAVLDATSSPEQLYLDAVSAIDARLKIDG